MGEPLHTTLRRTVSIAAVVGLVIALSTHRSIRAWPAATLVALWFSFGGHWVEVAFLRQVRPRLRPAPRVQVGARLLVWFVGGVGLSLGLALSARALLGSWRTAFPAWYWGGLAFVAIELVVHVALQLRRLPSFYNGRG